MSIKPYTVEAEDTRAVIYRFGEIFAIYDIVSEAYDECDRLNAAFIYKAEVLHRAICAYNNAPRGWVWEARIDQAVIILDQFLSTQQSQ